MTIAVCPKLCILFLCATNNESRFKIGLQQEHDILWKGGDRGSRNTITYAQEHEPFPCSFDYSHSNHVQPIIPPFNICNSKQNFWRKCLRLTDSRWFSALLFISRKHLLRLLYVTSIYETKIRKNNELV